MRKTKLDKTSVVMIIIFCVLVVGAAAGFAIAAILGAGDENASESGTVPQQETEEIVPEVQKAVFDDYMELSDKFLEVCRAGDVEAMYQLYYGDLLEEMRLNMEETPSKAEFDSKLRSDMLMVTGFEEYEYGSVELPPTQSPGSYAAFIYSMANNGADIPIDINTIENCVNLVVYINNQYQTNHFMVQIDGYWYFVV